MPKATTESIAKRAMRDICKEAIPLYLRRKGATDIDMDCLARIVRDAAQEGKRMGEKIGYDKGQEAGFDHGRLHGDAAGYKRGLKNGRALALQEKRKPVQFATDATGVPGKSARVIVAKLEPMDARVAKKVANAIKKTRRVMAAKELP